MCVAGISQQAPDRVGQVEEHAAAGAAGQAGDHVHARAIGSQRKAGFILRGLQHLRIGAGLNLGADPAGNGRVVNGKAETAQGPRPVGRDLLARQAGQPGFGQPAADGLLFAAWLHVVRGPLQAGQQDLFLGHLGLGIAPGQLLEHIRIGVDFEQPNVRQDGG